MINLTTLITKSAGNIAKAVVGTALLAACVIPAWAQSYGGYYQLTQRNVNGNVYTGVLSLDGSLRGQVTWANHMQSAPFQASLNGNNLRFTLSYPGAGLVGNYSANLSDGGSRLVDGSCWSNTGDSGVWAAQR